MPRKNYFVFRRKLFCFSVVVWAKIGCYSAVVWVEIGQKSAVACSKSAYFLDDSYRWQPIGMAFWSKICCCCLCLHLWFVGSVLYFAVLQPRGRPYYRMSWPEKTLFCLHYSFQFHEKNWKMFALRNCWTEWKSQLGIEHSVVKLDKNERWIEKHVNPQKVLRNFDDFTWIN